MPSDIQISIHALREEGDNSQTGVSTRVLISIHALREEGDPRRNADRGRSADFYPRPPRGGRRAVCAGGSRQRYFYPRPPRGGRRRVSANSKRCKQISIHALREEGDLLSETAKGASSLFLSTPSARRATDGNNFILTYFQFLSTPSARRATTDTTPEESWIHQFLSTPSARRATGELRFALPSYWYFYPRPPRGGRRQLWRQCANGR